MLDYITGVDDASGTTRITYASGEQALELPGTPLVLLFNREGQAYGFVSSIADDIGADVTTPSLTDQASVIQRARLLAAVTDSLQVQRDRYQSLSPVFDTLSSSDIQSFANVLYGNDGLKNGLAFLQQKMQASLGDLAVK